MPSRAAAVPEGYNAVMPYLRVRGGLEAVDFYKRAFGAKKRMHLMMPDGRLGHAELEIGGSIVMLSDEFPEMGIVGPKALKGVSATFAIYVADCDKATAKAVAAGAKVLSPPTDEFYGDRTAKIEDPFGHVWSLQHQREKLTTREMQKRLDRMMAEAPTPATPAKSKRKT